jgi:transposase
MRHRVQKKLNSFEVGRVSRPRADDRRIINGILYVLTTECRLHEGFFGWLKSFRSMIMRYEKLVST